MMGKSVIHDFHVCSQYSGNPPTPPTHVDEISGLEYNSTGFGQGEHRMMLSAYDFVDPGVYGRMATSIGRLIPVIPIGMGMG